MDSCDCGVMEMRHEVVESDEEHAIVAVLEFKLPLQIRRPFIRAI